MLPLFPVISNLAAKANGDAAFAGRWAAYEIIRGPQVRSSFQAGRFIIILMLQIFVLWPATKQPRHRFKVRGYVL